MSRILARHLDIFHQKYDCSNKPLCSHYVMTTRMVIEVLLKVDEMRLLGEDYNPARQRPGDKGRCSDHVFFFRLYLSPEMETDCICLIFGLCSE